MTISMEELFNLIHRKQAETMLELLEGGDVSPQALNAINKFLSDNNISGIKGENKALNNLSEGLAAYEEGDNVSMFPGRN